MSDTGWWYTSSACAWMWGTSQSLAGVQLGCKTCTWISICWDASCCKNKRCNSVLCACYDRRQRRWVTDSLAMHVLASVHSLEPVPGFKCSHSEFRPQINFQRFSEKPNSYNSGLVVMVTCFSSLTWTSPGQIFWYASCFEILLVWHDVIKLCNGSLLTHFLCIHPVHNTKKPVQTWTWALLTERTCMICWVSSG